VHLHGEAVEAVGAIERQAREAILDLENDGLVVHARSPKLIRRMAGRIIIGKAILVA